MSDAELSARLRADDSAALDALIRKYWAGLVRYAADIAGDSDAGHDVAQEAFVRLWQHRRDWRVGGSVRAWLFQTARNLAVSEYRRREVRARWATGGTAADALPRTPLEDAEDDELRTAIRDALARLAPRRREAFVLFYLRGLSYREAAEIMGIRPQSVANHLQLAIADLRSELADFMPQLPSSEAPPSDRDAARDE